MKTLQKLDHWSATHQSIWLDLLRCALGIFIFIKGILFAADLEGLNRILINSTFEFMAFGLVHYVVFFHLVGGILIAMGLLTRYAIIFQLPILLGAVLFINTKGAFFTGSSEFIISVVTLVLLLFYLVYGSGKFSTDEYMRTHKDV